MTQEQRALQESLRDWAKRASPVTLARDGSAGTIPKGLAELGLLDIPREGTLADVAAALEELAIAMTPGPVLPALLAAVLQEPRATVALTPGTLKAAPHPDGTLRVSGETDPLLWSGPDLLTPAATAGGDAWILLGHDRPGVTVSALTPLDFSRELATVRLDDVTITPQDLRPGLTSGRVRDLAATLFAAEAAGVAAWCAATAAAYARTRRQFGRLIGEFQAVKHLCATMACRAERAAALAWDAARTADEDASRHPLAAATAAALALDDAVENAKDCIQVLGGIGFTWEHDAHLYLRRALALRQLPGQHPHLADPHRHPGPHDPAHAGASARARSQSRSQSRSTRASPPRAGPAIEKYGTPDQRERFLGPTRRAEITWCQLFSEPKAGSDLASLRTKAVRTGQGWRLTGQKVWTSLARQADRAICLARTDPDVPKHQGITYFLVDMGAPGIEIRPLREITGREMFNEVFLDDVFVPDDCVLGAPGDGWRIARSTLRVRAGRHRRRIPTSGQLLAVTGSDPFDTERPGLPRGHRPLSRPAG